MTVLNASGATASPGGPARTRIFFSYKRNTEPDNLLVSALYEALRERGYELFIDRLLPVGAEWSERIKTEIRNSDFFLALLSRSAVQSEMLEGEVRAAYDLAREQNGRPRILPVRVANHDPFRSPISIFLDQLNWAVWESPADTPRLVDELTRAMDGGQLSVETTTDKASA